MPEGHTIHKLARDHTRWLAGQTVSVSSPQGRFAEEASSLDGLTFQGAEAWGKHLFHRYSRGLVVHIHLGLIGRFRMRRVPMPEPRGALRMRVQGEERGIDLRGPMVCRLGDESLVEAVSAKLGPDPLRDDGDREVVWATLQRKRTAIGTAWLDQSVIAGVGNVYRAEILFLEGIHPSVRCRDLTRSQFDALWDRTAAELADGVRLGRIVTVDPDESGVSKRSLKRGQRVYVYKRTTCRRCGGAVRAWTLGGRRCFACETCQPPPT